MKIIANSYKNNNYCLTPRLPLIIVNGVAKVGNYYCFFFFLYKNEKKNTTRPFAFRMTRAKTGFPTTTVNNISNVPETIEYPYALWH